MSDPKATALALIDALEADDAIAEDWMASLPLVDALDAARPHADAIRSLIADGAALAELMGRWSIRHDPHNRESKRYELMVIGADRIFYGPDLLTALRRAIGGQP